MLETRGKPRTRIADSNFDELRSDTGCLDGYLTRARVCVRNGIHRVTNKIEQHLLDLQPIGHYQWQVACNFEAQANVLPLKVGSGQIDGLPHDRSAKTYLVPADKLNKKGGRVELSMTSDQVNQLIK